jgi:hypothetical protein
MNFDQDTLGLVAVVVAILVVLLVSQPSAGGTITCTNFTDANGREYDDWILAIRLFSG